ncbi:MAG: MFS transporter [Alphaproteobacteria bacterium]|nr:MFS transporter [Alphaproteobacteria bacterium]
MSPGILKTRRFLPLLIVQFFGAFNDNLFKNALMAFIAYRMAARADMLANVVAGLFILPFFLFSATAGQLADKYDRARITRILKIVEMLLLLFAGVVFYMQNVWLLSLLLFGLGTHSTFFGPIKYALLPQLLAKDELIQGNGYIEGSTYISIIIGSVLGTLLPVPAVVGILVSCAAVGYAASRFIPPAPGPRPHLAVNRNLFRETMHNIRLVHSLPTIWRCILGATWFWMVGTLVLTQLFPLASSVLHVGKSVIAFFLVLFSIGVAIGTLSCNKLLRGAITMRFVPWTAVGMGVCAFALHALTERYTPNGELAGLGIFLAAGGWGFALTLFIFAIFSGLYIVPLNAMMQNRAPHDIVARVIAGNNIVNALGMVSIAALSAVLLGIGFTISELFLMLSVASIFVAVFIARQRRKDA